MRKIIIVNSISQIVKMFVKLRQTPGILMLQLQLFISKNAVYNLINMYFSGV